MATYDPLELLTRAQQGSQSWLLAMDQAIARQNELQNKSYADAFARDKLFQTYPSDLYSEISTNNYRGDAAQMGSRLIPDQESALRSTYQVTSGNNQATLQDQSFAQAPNIIEARRKAAEDKYLSPVAAGEAAAATYGVADPAARSAAQQQVINQYPGAYTAAATLSGPTAQTATSNVIDAFSVGNLAGANQLMQQYGMGTIKTNFDGTYTLVEPNGTESQPMNMQGITAYIQSKAGLAPTRMQTSVMEMQKAAAEAALKLAEKSGDGAGTANAKARLDWIKAYTDAIDPQTQQLILNNARAAGHDLMNPGAAAYGTPSAGGVPPDVAAAAGIQAPSQGAQPAKQSAAAAAMGLAAPAAPTTSQATPSNKPNASKTYGQTRGEFDKARVDFTEATRVLKKFEESIKAAGGKVTPQEDGIELDVIGLPDEYTIAYRALLANASAAKRALDTNIDTLNASTRQQQEANRNAAALALIREATKK